jgi:hypothetical protein
MPEESLTIAEMFVPAGVTGVGFAVRLWMIGPTAPVPELPLLLDAPPVPELLLELPEAPAPLLDVPVPELLLEVPPVPELPPCPEHNPTEVYEDRLAWQAASSFAFTVPAHVDAAMAGKEDVAQHVARALQLSPPEIVPFEEQAIASVASASAA